MHIVSLTKGLICRVTRYFLSTWVLVISHLLIFISSTGSQLCIKKSKMVRKMHIFVFFHKDRAADNASIIKSIKYT